MRTAAAIKHYEGKVADLAKALGITPQAVYQWGATVPDSSAFKLQVLTNGALVVTDKQPRSRRAGVNAR
jgi:predicted transcriptional regulator